MLLFSHHTPRSVPETQNMSVPPRTSNVVPIRVDTAIGFWKYGGSNCGVAFYILSHSLLWMVAQLGSAVDLLNDCTPLTSLSSSPDYPPDTASWMSNLPHRHSHLINVSYVFPALRPRGLGAPWFHPFMPHILSVSRSVGSSFRVHPKSDHLSPLPHPGSSPIVSQMAGIDSKPVL